MYYSMFRIKYGMYRIKDSCTGKHHKYSHTLRSMDENYEKCYLTTLCCIKCNEINVHYSNEQKHAYYNQG